MEMFVFFRVATTERRANECVVTGYYIVFWFGVEQALFHLSWRAVELLTPSLRIVESVYRSGGVGGGGAA